MSKFGTIQSHKQKLYLNGKWVAGVNSVDGEFAIPNEQVSSIGAGFIDSFRVGEFQGTFNFSKFLVGPDYFYELIQADSLDGLINYEGQNIGIKQAIITSYSCKGSVNSVVESSISGIVFGKIGGSDFDILPSLDEEAFIATLASPGVKITSQDNIELTNRLLDFNISVEIPRFYKRVIGNSKPTQNAINFPIVCRVSLTAAVHDYQIPVLEDFECDNSKFDLLIDLGSCQGQVLQTFDFSDGKLVNVSFGSTLDDELTASLEYECLVNELDSLVYVPSP